MLSAFTFTTLCLSSCQALRQQSESLFLDLLQLFRPGLKLR